MLEYSTLKPDTSSDSASVRSNGTLLVSANVDTKNIILAGNRGIIYHMWCWYSIISSIFNDPTHSITAIIINPMATS